MVKVFRVSSKIETWLIKQPETAMGVQIVAGEGSSLDEAFIVFSGQFMLHARDTFLVNGKAEPIDFQKDLWDDPEKRGEATHLKLFEEWLKPLPLWEASTSKLSVLPLAAFIIFPRTKFLIPPQPMPKTYGHLPFKGRTGVDETYYRWEPTPISKRIRRRVMITEKLSNGTEKKTPADTVAKDTFAAPMSEVPFMPTGFSSVARQALPQLLPACYRWELHPPANTPMRCGAIVPMFGQSGGGVEVAFPDEFVNVGPIANPVVLPAL